MIAHNCNCNIDPSAPSVSPASIGNGRRPSRKAQGLPKSPVADASEQRLVLRVQISQYVSATVLKLTGPANLDNMQTVYRHFIRLATARPKRTVLDVSELSFLCSPAVGQIVSLQSVLRKCGEQLVIAGPNANIFGLLQILRLDRTMVIVPTVSQALAK